MQASLNFLIENIVHLGYLLQLSALMASDVLMLRIMLAIAQAVVASYAFSRGVHAIAGWNLVLIGINSYWVVRILRERRAVTIPAELQDIYQQHFAALSAGDFLRFWATAEPPGPLPKALTQEGEVPKALYWLADGSIQLSKQGQQERPLQTPGFVGEMSVLTNRSANATVSPGEDVSQWFCWTRETLDKMRATQPVVWSRLQSAMGLDLVRKIQREEARYSASH
ncbi:MAG: cyclic nucleotide-binding domain-containing protein [Oceanococcus sp.]